MKKSYYLNKDLILGAINAQNKNVSQFCKEVGVNRCNFYQYLNRAYSSPRSRIFNKIAEVLGIAYSLLWTEE